MVSIFVHHMNFLKQAISLQGNVTHEESCNKFYECRDEKIYLTHECPEGKIFLEDECIDGDETSCAPTLNLLCDRAFFEARIYPGSQTLFVGCIRGFGIVYECYADEIFDRNTLKCITV
jgi:hypothetical protein